ncbi:MAG: YlxR family protein [Lachnospiraceae bacterium]|nr:YlxR family protein [Lachnospiraceae bacterium]
MSKKIPLRQCIGCNEMKAKKEMLRILKTTEDEVVLDTTGKLNGRGAYLCKNVECLKKAVKNKGIERSFKMPIDKTVYEKLEKEFLNIESE